MSTLTWATPQTNIANFAKTTNATVTVAVTAVDSNPSSTLTYSIVSNNPNSISGNLPIGFSIDSATGVISGNPSQAYSQSTYFTYEFEVQVSNGTDKLFGVFSITIINQPELVWETAPGTIANLGVNLPANLQISATDLANDGAQITYSLISGSFPTGMTLTTVNTGTDLLPVWTGIISGTPVLDNTAAYITTQTYNFVIRARASDGATVNDASYNIIVTNTINSDFSWITQAGNLGTIPVGNFYQLELKTQSSTNANVTYSLISGELPLGMQILPNGYIQGVPSLAYPIAVNSSDTFKFTVRASDTHGHVRDQAFSLIVTNYFAPIIEPSVIHLGTVFDGSYYQQEISVVELSPNVAIQWSNVGLLPPGLAINNINGATYISGYVQPVYQDNGENTAGYDFEKITSGVITYEQPYDAKPYDYGNLASRTLSYTFSVQAYDGANYDVQTYVLEVVSRQDFTADNANLTADVTSLTVDSGATYYPVILNANVSTLPTARANTEYSYQFVGYDYQGLPITYLLANTVGTFDANVSTIDIGFDSLPFDSYDPNSSHTTSLPGTLQLDPATGWLYGNIGSQTAAYQEYQIGINLQKTYNGNVYTSDPAYFTLPVLGSVTNTITWNSPANLGSVDNGSVSELTISATSTTGVPVIYRLVDQKNVPIRLPQGLILLPTGEVSGRVSFEAFSIDAYQTTFDSGELSIDKNYTFTVEAITDDFTLFSDGTYNVPPSATATKEFTISLNVINTEPYEDLYLHAMPDLDQRQIFNNLVARQDIFVPDLIYRREDPWFGVATDMTMLFASGLKASDISSYIAAIKKNHYIKTYQFGDVKTAVVLDNNYNVKYEVVYLEVIDPDLDSAGQGPSEVLNLSGTIANPYIDANGNQYTTVYPDSSSNMLERVVAGVGYYDQSTLPEWMTSNQLGSTTGSFNVPLGYTRAVVLAYTKPNASNLIAYRLKNSGVNLDEINFSVDRYLLDDYYTKNYNIANNTYYSGRETTFDASPNKNIGAIVSTVEYAASVQFDQINGRPVDYIISNGGIDGIVTFQDGDKLIFAKQERFINSDPYDGWIYYYDEWIGTNLSTPTVIGGYDSESYDRYSVVPGYLEKIQGTAQVNQRGGIWQINIRSGIVYLSFVQEILPYDRVRVSFGRGYGGTVLYYNNRRVAGQNVPEYSLFNQSQFSIAGPTTFNAGTTKFFSGRDRYYTPNSQDKYVKFPQFGVFV